MTSSWARLRAWGDSARVKLTNDHESFLVAARLNGGVHSATNIILIKLQLGDCIPVQLLLAQSDESCAMRRHAQLVL